MPFVPFKKKASSDASTPAGAAPDFSKKFARKRKPRRAPAQKALTAPSGRSMSGGGR